MNETDYNDLLYEKMQQEYDAFIAGLKLMSNEQVIDSAYEKVIKSDILIECENGRLDQKEAKALYLEKYPLDRIYQDWLKSDVSYMGMIRDTTPKGIATLAMLRTGLIQSTDNPRFEGFWQLFESDMERLGYIHPDATCLGRECLGAPWNDCHHRPADLEAGVDPNGVGQ